MRFEKDMVIFIPEKIFEEMKSCVDSASPNEACGLLFGVLNQIKNPEIENDFFYHYHIKKFECIESDQKSTVSFLINNIETLHEIIEEKRKEDSSSKNLNLLSIFHSHPGSAYPSGFDENHMRYLDKFSKLPNNYVSKTFKNQIWTIMNANNFDLNGFIYLQDEFLQIEVKILDED
ncbi:MAG: hypothetical protein EU539_02490 [Promethearchaeota archaeon]|nr:MAG: hypothetical protein EU539_02490 [Candidatus Lokiarchaeota archaeon]